MSHTEQLKNFDSLINKIVKSTENTLEHRVPHLDSANYEAF